jgi:zinc transporter ZupT
MDISRRLGILVFCGVPAIIGGGIIYALFGSYVPVFVFETLLIFFAGGIIARS